MSDWRACSSELSMSLGMWISLQVLHPFLWWRWNSLIYTPVQKKPATNPQLGVFWRADTWGRVGKRMTPNLSLPGGCKVLKWPGTLIPHIDPTGQPGHSRFEAQPALQPPPNRSAISRVLEGT